MYKRHRFLLEVTQHFVWLYHCRHQRYGGTLFLDDVFMKIHGLQHCLWCAVDQGGEVVDVFLQSRRDGKAAACFFKRLLCVSGNQPRHIVTDKLRSCGAAHRKLIPDTIHDISQYTNNGAELSHQLDLRLLCLRS